MRLLVLGGTSFVGRHAVDAALTAGHDVELFHRGLTGRDVFPELVHHRGDRDTGDYASLTGAWDAVLDVSAYTPAHVAGAADALLGRAGFCVFVSTVSVYDHTRMAVDGADEAAPRLPAVRGERSREEYGGLKVACEDDLSARWGDRAAVVRPGVVAGPHDPTDRFTWWVRAAARGDEVTVPRPDQPVQVVDARDLGALCVELADRRSAVTVNAVGPAQAVDLAGLLAACAEAAGTSPRLVTGPAAEDETPLLLPEDGSWDAVFRVSSASAHEVGLRHRPLDVTASATLEWDRAR